MATDDRTQIDDLVLRLEQDPPAFGFYQALRLIEAASPDVPGFGRSRRARQDPVRLGQQPYLQFAPSTLSAISRGNSHRPARLYQNFHGLFGPNGPLPVHLTEFAMERQISFHDPTLARFCDIFHHRLLSLFYRIWADAEPAVCEDRPRHNRFDKYVGALAGLGLPGLAGRDAMPDAAKRFHAGHLSRQTRNAEGLLGIISQQFDMPVGLEEYQPEWLNLPEESRLYLGRSLLTGSLGVNAVIGERSFERQFRFALVFGPLSREQFERMLPNRPSAERLNAIVHNYVGLEFGWEYRMFIPEAEKPVTQLGCYGELGYSTWLHGEREGDEYIDFFHSPRFETSLNESHHGRDIPRRAVQ
ncbi:MAG: type VI secretion system baseplate subunit TssG [Wenzhouxiangella sp.]|nr:type VI secretion system baseplate subunit TssG [Wenzhouxiangella sp.]MCH8477295.1 type VI secretion system baseplate subunit TssG [Wenzhouxiangella sp.]TVR95955.1 MAG: type VI secretion system baseplate subunit TssG [Wenzhouxiangellaceae bacterium]